MGVAQAYHDHNGMDLHHDPQSIPHNTPQIHLGKSVQEPLVVLMAYNDHNDMELELELEFGMPVQLQEQEQEQALVAVF